MIVASIIPIIMITRGHPMSAAPRLERPVWRSPKELALFRQKKRAEYRGVLWFGDKFHSRIWILKDEEYEEFMQETNGYNSLKWNLKQQIVHQHIEYLLSTQIW